MNKRNAELNTDLKLTSTKDILLQEMHTRRRRGRLFRNLSPQYLLYTKKSPSPFPRYLEAWRILSILLVPGAK